MKRLNRNLISFVVFSLVISCSNPQRARIERDLIKSNNDSLIVILPETHRADPYLQAIKEKWSRTLGLDKIEAGSSATEIRIWEDLKAFSGQVFIINYNNGNWTAYMYNYNYNVSIGSYPDSLSGERKELGEPKSGWMKFLNKLLDLKILTLPSHESLLNYNVPSDQLFVRVEIAKKNYYRLYEYPNPYDHQNFESAQNMVQILQLVKKEFLLQ